MDKEAQIMEALQNAGTGIMDAVKGTPDKLSEFWNNLSDTQKSTITNSLAGGAIGGLGSGLLGGDMKDSTLAALLGAGAGAGLTLGGKALFGDAKLPAEAESGPGIIGSVAGGIGNTVASNPFLTLGTGLGAYGAVTRGGMPFSSAATEAGFDEWVKSLGDKSKKRMITVGTTQVPIHAVLEHLKLNRAPLNVPDTKSVIQNAKVIPNALKQKLVDLLTNNPRLASILDAITEGERKRTALQNAMRGEGAAKYLPKRIAWWGLPLGAVGGLAADNYIKGET
jgi:hypothetical protein